jgi:heme-degrading monooxygenase HmoA
LHIGVVYYKFKLKRIVEAVQMWKEHILPEAERQPGFIKAELFIDEGTGDGFDIGYWATLEDAQRYEDSGTFELMNHQMKDYLKKPPKREKYKVMT